MNDERDHLENLLMPWSTTALHALLFVWTLACALGFTPSVSELADTIRGRFTGE